MQYIRRMNVLERPQHLIDKVLNMIKTQTLLGINDSVQIRLHQFTDNVNILEIVHIPHHGWHHIVNAHNVLMFQMLQQLDLTKDTLGVDLILKSLGHHLNGHAGVQLSVCRGNDNAVRTRSNHTSKRILGVDRKSMIPSLERVSAVGSRAFEPAVRPRLTRGRSSTVWHDDLSPVFRCDGAIVHRHGMTSRIRRKRSSGGGGKAMIILHVVRAILADGAAAFVAHGAADLRGGVADFGMVVALFVLVAVAGAVLGGVVLGGVVG
mmetsp:Transcript_39627/g.69597  ORF Transcript_39627/g.69597 Transcript_39627/m.69597 type:complete len:264 (+) Transcript_39627:926-1717(+)